MKYVQTVTGAVAPEQLGKTMTHDHLLWDQSCYWQVEPAEASQRDFVHMKVAPEMMHKLYYKQHQNRDNAVQTDVATAIEEAFRYKLAGGGAIVDVTPEGLGRDPDGLREISIATGLHIIMGCGFYIKPSHPKRIRDMTKEQIAGEIIREIRDGVGVNRIKPGIIGEIGVNSMDCAEEVNALRGAAITQRETGLALSVHPPIVEDGKVLDIIEEEGGDLSKVVMCHLDRSHEKPSYHDAIAKRGAFVEYDTFGYDFPVGFFWMPRDVERIIGLKRQIDMGNLKSLVVSQDIAFKSCLVRHGGFGYAHILRDLPPFMLNKGITYDEMDAITIENPKRLLSIEG